MNKILKLVTLCIMIMSIVLITLLVKNKNISSEMIDLLGYSKEDAEKYAKDNNIILEFKEEYNEAKKDTVIKQNIAEGSIIDKNDKLILTISLGEVPLEKMAELKVNELGRIPVMMYHGIHNKQNSETDYIGGNVDKDGYQRTAEAFRKDLEFYYQNGYRMISLNDYVDGFIDVPLGYSPIVLTFDDGLENNIKVIGINENGEIEIDPNSAVGILEEFKQKYPDYNVTATFFVNSTLFNQKEYNDRILNWLVDHNYDIGNHSANHADFTKISYEQSVEEIGSVYKLLEAKIPNKYVNIVALPFGSPYSSSHSNFGAIIKGNYGGFNYETKSTLRVGWESDYSPFSTDFNPQFIKRIRAYDNNGEDFDIDMNFKQLENNRFISDGDINTVTIPKSRRNELKDIKLKIQQY